MLNLKNTTFIIPIRIDSPDREFNFQYVIQYLCDKFETNIIIKESDTESKAKELLHSLDFNKCNVLHLFETNDSSEFHRTRLLNEMLHQVKTHVVVNYDIDIILEPETYLYAQNEILKHGADLVYPYFNGMSQKRVFRDKVHGNFFCAPINSENGGVQLHHSICGHCQFFRTSAYREGGMENENFISYGPEDSERMHRFQTLGYKVIWLDNYIWHLEHVRTENSNEKNPHFHKNDQLYKYLSSLNADELKEHYKNQNYLKKYE